MIEPIEIYNNTPHRKRIYKMLMDSAGKMLSKAKIVNNLEAAIVLAKIRKKHNSNGIKTESESRDDLDLFMLLMNCYEPIIDEVAIVGAFENYAKSLLLRKQYIVHEMKGRENKDGPLHIKTFLSNGKGSGALKYSTLSAATILKLAYAKIYSLSDGCIDHLKKFKDTRNFLHMDTKMTARITLSELEAIDELKRAIERYY